MEHTIFNEESDQIGDKDAEIAKVLLANQREILWKLADAGMHEDEEVPYAYYVPTGLSFPIGDLEGGLPIRSIYAVVIMARASYANACFLDCDKEGYPELPEFCGGEPGFHRVKVTDPFAWHLDAAIREYRDEMVLTGKARIVNGRFFKVA